MGTDKLNAYQLISELQSISEAMLKPGEEWKFIDHSNDKEENQHETQEEHSQYGSGAPRKN